MIPEKKRSGNFIPVLILLAVAAIANWPLWVYSMKFDILDQYLPWRILAGDCLRNGMLPLWNPFTHLGYPLHADPQSGAWYPVVWLIGGTTGYNLYWIHAEYLFHVWLAGTGMFLLIYNITANRNIALLAGMSYMLSGFFTGNAQHLTWIISGAWLPFILFSFLMMMRTGKRIYIRYTALAFYMMLTGGYPAFSIITVYLLLIVSIIFIIRNKLKSKPVALYIKNILLLAVTSAFVCAVMLVSSYDSFQLAGRAEGLSKDLAMANPFSPQCMISFLFPFSSLQNRVFFDTDISMSNGYFGIVMFAGVLLSLFRKKTFTEKLLLYGSLFCLLAAMGSYTPLRGWLYDFIPLMKLFRMPSLFRLFAISGFIMLASLTLNNLYVNHKEDQLKKVLLFFAVIVISVPAILFLVTGTSISFPSDFNSLEQCNFINSFSIQSVAMLISIVILILFIQRKISFSFYFIDLILTAWICAPVTVVNSIRVSTGNEYIKNLNHNFPVPANEAMQNFKDRTNIFGPYWCNLGILRKQPVYDGYNNFQTHQYIAFESSPLFNYVLKNPIAYLTSTSNIKTTSLPVDTSFIYNDSTVLYIDNVPSATNSNIAFKGDVKISAFKPTSIRLKTSISTAGYVTLQQQYLKGWKVYVDDEKKELLLSNGFTMSVAIPEGNHTVLFKFTDRIIQVALCIS
ncbi:MAG: hypothetical protein ABI772_12805, partial [Bacteroidota bacterium]